jgi:hypothetical protein
MAWANEVEGLVDFTVRGGSSPLACIFEGPDSRCETDMTFGRASLLALVRSGAEQPKAGSEG